MARVLALVIGMGAIFGAAYFMLKGNLGSGTSPDGQHSAPKETMDRWHDKAKEIDQLQQQRVQDVGKTVQESQ